MMIGRYKSASMTSKNFISNQPISVCTEENKYIQSIQFNGKFKSQ